MYLFFFGCVGSSFLCEGFLQLRQAGATPHRGARASHCRGLSCCRAQAPDAQAQQLWLTGLAAPRHVGSSRIGTRTHVPCIGRRTPNHWATREALEHNFLKELFISHWVFLSPLSNISLLYMQGFISGLLVLFRLLSMCLFLCQYPNILNITLKYSLKSGSVMSLPLFFFLKIA